MTSRHVTTGVTLLVLLGILVLGLVVGVNRLFAPISTENPSAEPSTSCRTLDKGQRLRSEDVVVNVFNAGDKEGLAGKTLNALTNRGFLAGEVDNTPRAKVARVQVWIIKGEEAAGRLVASNFGPRTVVRTLKRDFAPDGVDVVVGDDLGKLARANRTVRVAEPLEVCPPSAAAG